MKIRNALIAEARITMPSERTVLQMGLEKDQTQPDDNVEESAIDGLVVESSMACSHKLTHGRFYLASHQRVTFRATWNLESVISKLLTI